eukprot:SAG11_NODE_14325_length_616_cov_2.524178_1_plen_64_part_10
MYGDFHFFVGLNKIFYYLGSRLELTNQQGIQYHWIDDEQGFPKPVAKVPELFGRGFYGRWKIEE